jgi:hypothetical protein
MPDSVRQRESRSSRAITTAQWTRNIFIALLPVFACFLGGATQKWEEGIVWAVLGLYLLVQPPRASLGTATNCVFAAFLLLGLVAYLPAHWFFFPAWRTALIDDFGVTLPATVSPQPWITAGAWLTLLGGMSWFYTVSARDLELRSVRFQLRLFVTGVVVLAAISIVFYYLRAAFPFWINNRGFGPFPNRNQTGNLFGIASIVLLACGQDDLRHGRKRWLVWVIALSILIAGLILNLSRSGIVILVGGSALWIFVVALRQRSPAWIALACSFLLLLLSAILILGGETLERFHLHSLSDTGMSTDFRWKIFRDAWELIRSSPWCGVGLGNFDAVFAIFRKESVGNTRALHPESDWLWLWAELGWPAIVIVLAGAALLIRRVLPLQEGTNQRFRLAALVGAMVFALHGLVDVSGHRVGTALAATLLLGLSLYRPLRLQPNRWVAAVFRIVGLILLLGGASWAVAALNKTLFPGSVGVSNAKKLSTIANGEHNFGEAISFTTRALGWAPLDWQLYFSRALAEVGAKQPANALDDFRRARFLEPNAYQVPLAEAKVWMSSNPTLAVIAWREAVRRAGPEQSEVYASILRDGALDNPAIRPLLEEIGLGQHGLALAYLGQISGAPFNQAVARLLKSDPNLGDLSDTEKLALFALWSERGDLETLAQTVQQHPDWNRYAWLGLAKYHASKNDFRAAYELTQRFGDPVALPRISPGPSFEELERRYYATPDNYAAGYALYREQMQRGRIDDALAIARHFTMRPNSPVYFAFLEAQCWAAKGNWERAWNAWLGYREAAARK